MKDRHSNFRFSFEIIYKFTTPIESPVKSFEQSQEEVLEKDANKAHVDHTLMSIVEGYASLNDDN